MTPGQIVFEAWLKHHRTWHDCGIEGWHALSDNDRADWEAAAQALLGGN